MPEINDTKEIPECTLPINLERIQKYERSETVIIAKDKDGTYHMGYLCGGSNTYLKMIMYKDNIVIPSKFKIYVLH